MKTIADAQSTKNFPYLSLRFRGTEGVKIGKYRLAYALSIDGIFLGFTCYLSTIRDLLQSML
jgi:hypothetical protein